jgi:CBS domain-containing protein
MRHLSDIIKHKKPLMMQPSATVKQACGHMRDQRVGAVLVTDEEARLLGIFTGRDAVCRVLAEAKDPGATTLVEVMTRDPRSMSPGRTAIEALRLMQDCGCRHLPIVEAGKVAGILSRGDFRGSEQDRLDEETGVWERI